VSRLLYRLTLLYDAGSCGRACQTFNVVVFQCKVGQENIEGTHFPFVAIVKIGHKIHISIVTFTFPTLRSLPLLFTVLGIHAAIGVMLKLFFFSY